MWRWLALGLCLASLACGGSSTAAPGGAKAAVGGDGEATGPAHVHCGDHGLYALPGSPPDEVEESDAGRAALTAFRSAEEVYEKGDASAASKKFLEAAQSLSRVKGDSDTMDYARYARQVSYHNALWTANEAGELPQMRTAIQKSASEDTVLADTIKALLGDEPEKCDEASDE
jgi:hypothetical protein